MAAAQSSLTEAAEREEEELRAATSIDQEDPQLTYYAGEQQTLQARRGLSASGTSGQGGPLTPTRRNPKRAAQRTSFVEGSVSTPSPPASKLDMPPPKSSTRLRTKRPSDGLAKIPTNSQGESSRLGEYQRPKPNLSSLGRRNSQS